MTTTANSDPLVRARELFRQGNTHHEAGRLVQARECYEEALTLAPGRASVLANLGLTLFKLDMFSQAEPILRQSISANTDHPAVPAALGLCQEALGRWQASIKSMQLALKINPQQSAAWMCIARCSNRCDDIPGALEAWDNALKLDPSAVQAWSERGSLLRHIGQLDAAAECFRRALALGADRELHEFYLAAVTPQDTAPPPPEHYARTLFDQYAADFDHHLVEQLGYSAHQRLIAPLLQMRPRYGLALDLGCGTGLCAQLLRPACAMIDGVDIAEKMVLRARTTGLYRKLEQTDLVTFLRHSNEPADAIVAADVFIYVGALEAVFAAARARLSNDGIFAFSVECGPGDHDVKLLPSLRYSHSLPYLLRLAAAHGMQLLYQFEAPIRHDQKTPVPGRYVYLQASVSSAA